MDRWEFSEGKLYVYSPIVSFDLIYKYLYLVSINEKGYKPETALLNLKHTLKLGVNFFEYKDLKITIFDELEPITGLKSKLRVITSRYVTLPDIPFLIYDFVILKDINLAGWDEYKFHVDTCKDKLLTSKKIVKHKMFDEATSMTVCKYRYFSGKMLKGSKIYFEDKSQIRNYRYKTINGYSEKDEDNIGTFKDMLVNLIKDNLVMVEGDYIQYYDNYIPQLVDEETRGAQYFKIKHLDFDDLVSIVRKINFDRIRYHWTKHEQQIHPDDKAIVMKLIHDRISYR